MMLPANSTCRDEIADGVFLQAIRSFAVKKGIDPSRLNEAELIELVSKMQASFMPPDSLSAFPDLPEKAGGEAVAS